MRYFIPLLFLGFTTGLQFQAYGQNQNQQYQQTEGQTTTTVVRPRLTKTNDISVGLRWGNVPGVDTKFWLDEVRAVNAALAFSDGNTAVSATYLYHFRGVIGEVSDIENADPFVPYVGVGAIGAFGQDSNFLGENTEDFGLALRIPLGVEYLTRGPRVGLFAELAPSFAVVPSTFTFVSGEVGARYYF